MGMTEWLINQISPTGGQNIKEKKERVDYFYKQNSNSKNIKKTTISKTIGFMFFNSNVILSLGNSQTK